MHRLAAFAGLDGVRFVFVRAEKIGLAPECDLRTPLLRAPAAVDARDTAGVAAQALFRSASRMATDVPSQSFRFSRIWLACRQPQLFVFPLCRFVCRTTVSFPQSQRQRQRCWPFCFPAYPITSSFENRLPT